MATSSSRSDETMKPSTIAVRTRAPPSPASAGTRSIASPAELSSSAAPRRNDTSPGSLNA
jgi:hypothetical protein